MFVCTRARTIEFFRSADVYNKRQQQIKIHRIQKKDGLWSDWCYTTTWLPCRKMSQTALRLTLLAAGLPTAGVYAYAYAALIPNYMFDFGWRTLGAGLSRAYGNDFIPSFSDRIVSKSAVYNNFRFHYT